MSQRPAARRPVIISRLTASDLPQIAALERQCFSQPWSENVLSLELQNPRAVFFVARVSGIAVGYVGMHRVLDEGYIANVAVGKDYRRHGIAAALVRRLLRYAKRERLLFTTLEVREGNAAAIALYCGMGFGEVGRRKSFYAAPVEDAVLMTRFFV